jgi:hypothetical protein
MSRRAQWIVAGGILAVTVAVALAWPPADPLAGVQTVALRTASATSEVDVTAELEVILNHRNLRIVSDERVADVVLTVSSVRADLRDVRLALSDGKLTGRASAMCRVVNVKTGRAYTMDLVLTLREGQVEASLSGRRFWEFWKPRATL